MYERGEWKDREREDKLNGLDEFHCISSCMCHVYHPIIRSSDHPIIRSSDHPVLCLLDTSKISNCRIASMLCRQSSLTGFVARARNATNSQPSQRIYNNLFQRKNRFTTALITGFFRTILQALFAMTIIKRARKYTVAHKTNQLTLNFK